MAASLTPIDPGGLIVKFRVHFYAYSTGTVFKEVWAD